MNTSHQILNTDARDLSPIASGSVQLVVTSPPYPMIEMWDELFMSDSPAIKSYLEKFDGDSAFELMHLELDKVWHEMYRVLADGCFACINIGDATRSLDGRFQLYSNHSRITQACKKIGFDILPVIIWKKTSNAPNKFMGSGMLPAGAYITLEHEYILIFRKNGKRVFSTNDEKKSRNESAFFWEERNKWFSDTWDLKGVAQKITNGQSRDRSAAYPLDLAYRLINMYSLEGETILDPFIGTGTTSVAALSSVRNSIGIEIDNTLTPLIEDAISTCKDSANQKTLERINAHKQFVSEYNAEKG
ncbi:MAG: site-specific DNA-methyltransferase, partial [bacterium]